MTFKPDFSLGNYVAEQAELPESFDQLRKELKRILEDQARLLNRKDTGQYEPQEIQINQTYPGANQQEKRYIYRKLIELGTLNTGVNNIAHGIAVGAPTTFVFTRIYGTIFDQTAPLFVPIPNDTILMTVDATNVNITIPIAYNNFSGNAVLEFYKN